MAQIEPLKYTHSFGCSTTAGNTHVYVEYEYKFYLESEQLDHNDPDFCGVEPLFWTHVGCLNVVWGDRPYAEAQEEAIKKAQAELDKMEWVAKAVVAAWPGK